MVATVEIRRQREGRMVELDMEVIRNGDEYTVWSDWTARGWSRMRTYKIARLETTDPGHLLRFVRLDDNGNSNDEFDHYNVMANGGIAFCDCHGHTAHGRCLHADLALWHINGEPGMSPAEAIANGISNEEDIVLNSKLKEVRDGLGLPVSIVARSVGTSTQTIRNAEEGKPIRLAIALKLAKFFGKTVDDLWSLPKDEETE